MSGYSRYDDAADSVKGFRKTFAAIVAVVIAFVTLFVVLEVTYESPRGALSVEIEAAVSHLRNLQQIANENDGSRAVLTGYDASIEYVKERLIEAGYEIALDQWLEVPVHTRLFDEEKPVLRQVDTNSQPLVEYAFARDFAGLRYGGESFDGAADVVFVDTLCTDDDVQRQPSLTNKIVALLSPASCTMVEVAQLAEEAGAVAVLFPSFAASFDNIGGRVRAVEWDATTGNDFVPTIVCLRVRQSIVQQLASLNDVPRLQIQIKQFTTRKDTDNVCVELGNEEQRANGFILAGAHADGVPEGPGIVDNGSGTAALLAIAERFIDGDYIRDAKQAVRFCWWAAEEIGLLGSRFYVRHYEETYGRAITDDVVLALNFDMLASPNMIPGIYDAKSASNPDTHKGNLVVQEALEGIFKKLKGDYKIIPMSQAGGSDYFAFQQHGVPVGAIASGATELKTDEERVRFGGVANAQLDPCYHQACDTINQISGLNQELYELLTNAAAGVVQEFVETPKLRELMQ